MSLFSKKNIKGFMSSVGVDLNPKLVTDTVMKSVNISQDFVGINAPFIGKIGLALDEAGSMRFGKFADPRAALRAKNNNKVLVPSDYGSSSRKAVPSTRGGDITIKSLAYDKIRETHLANGTLFEDPDFPCENSSLFYSQEPPRTVQWLRPGEICQDPQFIVDGASRFDVQQGELGDCWLLAAVACLSMEKDLFSLVVQQDQTFGNGYCGVFKFHFWSFGEWREVVVDDRLPTYNGRLIYLHSADRNEFWSALLEKAYAKLCGSYEALKGGTTSEALEDFTSGIAEMFDLRDKTPPNLLDIMLKSAAKRSMMACSINADPNQIEAKLPNGLVMGHAYSVTKIKVADVGSGGRVPLVRIRNPWGDYTEWKGAWSDNSREWNALSPEQRDELELTFDSDGEFWMAYDDFIREFERIEICHLGPQSLSGEDGDHDHGRCIWEEIVEHGEWRHRVNAGGCRNYLDTFWTNPQFKVTITDADDDDNDDKGTLIIGLMQKDRRALRKAGMDLLTIGYAIYELPSDHPGTLDSEFFKYNRSVARSPNFINLREISARHRLTPGTYVIVPSTFKPGEEADFMIRMFSEKPNKSSEMDEETGITDPRPDLVPQQISEDQVKKLYNAFVKVAGDDGEIDADELRDIINAAFSKGFQFDGFSLETCRSLISMMDVDHSGRLGFDEFRTLWELLRVWKTSFKRFDTDSSGQMNSYELRSALKSVGFAVSNNVFTSLAMRFSKRDGRVAFDDYIMCCARLRTVFEIWAATPRDDANKCTFDEDTFVNSVLYL